MSRFWVVLISEQDMFAVKEASECQRVYMNFQETEVKALH